VNAVPKLSESIPPYRDLRRELLARPGLPGPGRRQELTELTDTWLRAVFSAAVPESHGLALVAVGGYGRGELSPGSDLDLLLLHEGGRNAVGVAGAIWYPVWDSGIRLDHSVRTPEEARALAREDLAVLLGLLNARHVAGDPKLLESLRPAVLSDWRGSAVRRLAELRESCAERADRSGEVAFTLEPELKEGRGGLRDVSCLRAAAASWLVDRPHGDVDTAARTLLDVRDALHLTTGRSTDRLVLQEQDAVAASLGMADADSVLRTVAAAGRTIAYAIDVTWRRVEALTRPRRRGLALRRRPDMRPLGADLVEHQGEVALGAKAKPEQDALLPLRAASTAAQNGLLLSPESVDRLATAPELPEPWPAAARDALIALLGAGEALVPVWEALDQAGITNRLLPEWSLVRSRPQRNPIHRYTVDRHLVETAAEAGALTRRVNRPDLLLVAALLHDIGKGRRRGDHSVEGARLARDLATRMGFDAQDVELLVLLVREHLLLPDTATRRDLADPATVATIVDAVESVETLDLLHALTEADALATGPGAWTEWRAGLVSELVTRARSHLHGHPPPPPEDLSEQQRALVAAGSLDVQLNRDREDWTVTVVAPDRRGLLAAVSGVLALHRLSVRSATMRTEAGMAVDTWSVEPEYGDPPALEALRDDIRRALDRSLDVAALLDKRAAARTPARGPQPPPPRVDVVAGASSAATVMEVRAHDRLGLLHRLGRALTLASVDVRAARVSTLGAEVVDVFYVVDEQGCPLTDDRSREVARILRDVAG
jgi:[protein-PII] uridylyltransferase